MARKPKLQKKTGRLQLRLTQSEFEKFQNACRKCGREMSLTLRKWALVAIARQANGQDVEPPFNATKTGAAS